MQHQHDDHAHGSELSEMQLRVRALETILLEKGYIEPAALDALIETYETRIGPRNGARVVARAWVDPDFRARPFADGTAAIGALGFGGREGSLTSSLSKCLIGRHRYVSAELSRPIARWRISDPHRRITSGPRSRSRSRLFSRPRSPPPPRPIPMLKSTAGA
jgi:hypothetical protein